jgi:hypothetical protein
MPIKKKKDPDIITKNSDTPGMIGDYKPPSYDGSLESMVQLIREPGEKSGSTRTRVVELLRGEKDMEKLVETFDVMRKRADGNTSNLDRIAELSGINRSDAFGAVSRVLHRYNFDVTRLVISAVAARQAGRVAIAMANRAAHPDGIADRRLFMDVARATANSGGGGFTVNVPVTNTAVAQAKAEVQAEIETGGIALPQFEDGIKELSLAMRSIPMIAEKSA